MMTISDESGGPSGAGRRRAVWGLAGWLVITFMAAALGGIASTGAGDDYLQLDRPDWAPASWLFGPVWTLLYLMMGTAAWLVWRRAGFSGARPALTLFLVQLGANSLWTWIFFAWEERGLALAEILVLWVMIALTLVLFYRRVPLAGLLLLPYLGWVSYATALTHSIWRLNP